ncbi:MAG: sensor histidine kinase [Lachnospiraceae bacterium]|nr:sensor histidine kinase [Lachnospiraceae bacterium]
MEKIMGVNNKKILNPEFHMKQFSVLDVQEKERQRIARDLHDSSLQNLTYLVHQVELSSLYIDQDPLKAKLELASVETKLRKVIDDIRNIIYDLRPMTFDDLGLKQTLLNYFSLLKQECNYQILVDIDNVEDYLSDEKKEFSLIMIYRIIQECVQNAIEHSQGNRIEVSLKKGETSIFIKIQDNGTGFNLEDAEKKDRHFGLSVVKERVFLLGGNMSLNTEKGTAISIEIPRE